MITEAQAKRAGYYLRRGAYVGVTGDDSRLWYWQHTDPATPIYTGGRGYTTKRAALEALTDRLGPDAR